MADLSRNGSRELWGKIISEQPEKFPRYYQTAENPQKKNISGGIKTAVNGTANAIDNRSVLDSVPGVSERKAMYSELLANMIGNKLNDVGASVGAYNGSPSGIVTNAIKQAQNERLQEMRKQWIENERNRKTATMINAPYIINPNEPLPTPQPIPNVSLTLPSYAQPFINRMIGN